MAKCSVRFLHQDCSHFVTEFQSLPSNFSFFSLSVLLHEIPLFMGRLCLDSWIPILVQAWHWQPDIQGRVGDLRSIKNSSGPNVFGTLDQVKWPFPKTRKWPVVNQSTGNSVWEPLWKCWTYRNQRAERLTPEKYELSKPLIRLFVYWHQELYNVIGYKSLRHKIAQMKKQKIIYIYINNINGQNVWLKSVIQWRNCL